MLIVDSQVHIGGADTPDRPWPPGGAPRAEAVSGHQGHAAGREGHGRGEPGRDRSALVGRRPQRPGARGGAAASQALRGDGTARDRVPGSRALVAHWKKQPRRASRHRRAPPRAERCPFRDLHAHIRRLVDAFGPRRTFWGTDLTRMPCSYRACVNLFTQDLPWLEGDDLEWVMGRGVCEWLGWP